MKKTDASADLLDIRPLQPTIGAEIHDIAISKPLSAVLRDAIRAAVLEYKVVFYRDQHALTPESQAAFAKQFGPLYTHPSNMRDRELRFRGIECLPHLTISGLA